MSGRRAVRTVELFCGVGGFRIAADQLGLRTVFANDLSASACAVYRHQFSNPGVLREADIFDVVDEIPPHDILTGGFPCQPYSFAGKKKGHRDYRADTLDAICRVLELRRPQAFVLENVRALLSIGNGKHFRVVLRKLMATGYQIEWRTFNVADLGLPQNRHRLLIVGSLDGTSRHAFAANSREETIEYGRWFQVARWGRSFPSHGIARAGAFAEGSGSRENPAPRRAVRLRDVLEARVDESFDFTASTRARIKDSEEIQQFIDGVEVLYNQQGGRRMGYTIFGVNGLAPTLTSTSSRHYERFFIGGRYRRLTPVEYARVQGFPDRHCECVPVNERYVLLGNAIPPALADRGLTAALALLRKDALTSQEVGNRSVELATI